MAVEYANEDLKVNFQNTAPGGLTYSNDKSLDEIKIVGRKSSKVNCPGGSSAKKLCYTDITLSFDVSNLCPFTYSGHTFVKGSGVLTFSKITKSTTESNIPGGKDDQQTAACNGSWTNNSSGATVSCSCTIKIADAGQTDVKGE